MRVHLQAISRDFPARPALMLFAALLCVSVVSGALFAKSAPPAAGGVPGWLDTIPPRVEIMPADVYHQSVFMITLSANKRAIFYVGINNRNNLHEYRSPISVTKDTAVTVYYYGEDDFGNRSALDSIRYVLDTRMPRLSVTPAPGSYQKGVVVRFSADEPCRFEFVKDLAGGKGRPIPDSVAVAGVFEGFVAAIDSAGNRTVSDSLRYIVDTSTFQVSAHPGGGLFGRSQSVTFDVPKGVRVFYTFDPLAPPELFTEYSAPVRIPAGLNILRFFGRNKNGRSSEIQREKYILDTIAPKIYLRVGEGRSADTLHLSMKEHGIIRYEQNGGVPSKTSPQYTVPIVVPRKSRGILKTIAWDDAGNQSDILDWECKYDFKAPLVICQPAGGTFTRPPTLHIASDERASVYYTLDESVPDTNSLLYGVSGIVLSREGITTLRYFGVDDAGNRSDERSAVFLLDTKPPSVRVQIGGTLLQKSFTIRFIPSEPADIHYEVGGALPTRRSPVYKEPLSLQSGQTLSYMAIDSAGNASTVWIMDELKKPMVSPMPEAGMYNRKVTVTFITNVTGAVFWRMFPDTTFRPYRDSIPLIMEGSHSLEYYLETRDGLKSAIRRSEYFTDWTPPRVGINIKKGFGDSVSVFFECSENATVYYTTDGSNPLVSPKTGTAGNKYLLSRDRISILRGAADVKLAFYAEDAAGNQSALTILDVFKPRVVPNVPAGADRIYDRILSVSLNTYDQSTIYFARHGRLPSTDSAVFSAPVTLIESDTIVAFAVDASGFRGDPDKFVYLIDLPPSPHFTVSPDTVYVGTRIVFDASTSVDKESLLAKLLFRWDFDGDGKFESQAVPDPRVAHTYVKPGKYTPLLEVIDENKRTNQLARTILVRDRCPESMTSAVDGEGNGFCIDMYEWPNREGKSPETGVSWVEAKIACIDAGKRLCLRREWESVCRGGSKNVYPYGDSYDAKRCPTEGIEPWDAGSFKRCHGSKVFDMIGNAWEWIEDKHGDYPTMMGGSIRDGKDAHCSLVMPSTLAARADDVGFRCCK